MASDLTVFMENQPGAVAHLGTALGNAGVNIEGGCAVAEAPGRAAIHILVPDAAAARSALTAGGIEVGPERDVVVTDIEDRPGTLGAIGRKLADAGVNIELLYLTAGGKLVLGVDDPGKARAAL